MNAQQSVGQRWMSDAEPELGLGVITALEPRTVTLSFPTADTVRRYVRNSAPIRRILFRPGDVLRDGKGVSRKVTGSKEDPGNGLVTYGCEDGALPEPEIADTVNVSTPFRKLLNQRTDSSADFASRLAMLHFQADLRNSPVRGFAGGRIELLPHQLFIADTVSQRRVIRALLADETGLGKTIEACLILHRLVVTGRITRVLILLPSHLMHQWFVELLRRFNLSFTLLTEAYCAASQEGENPFIRAPLGIAGIRELAETPERAEQAVEAGWDMVIVDEAHHLMKEGAPFALLSRLAGKVKHILLLTATPEQNGLENLFASLQLLDPKRYVNFESFREESDSLKDILVDIEKALSARAVDIRSLPLNEVTIEAPRLVKNQSITLEQLIDVYGIGRMMFRNTRRNIPGFPARRVFPVPLVGSSDGDPRVDWLLKLVQENPWEKFLVICSSGEKAERIQGALLRKLKLNIALFREEMTILQRDRNAAWFAVPEGARLLISSEIGSEGRNFQFCRSLVLFDLPLNPELLEQRIGRLDRIGQMSDIRIYVPYIQRTFDEILFRFYHEGLGAFERNVPSALRVFDAMRPELVRLSEKNGQDLPEEIVARLVKETRDTKERLSRLVTDPRDRLFEIRSFQPGRAHALIREILDPAVTRKCEVILGRLLRAYGIGVDDAGAKRHVLLTEQVTDQAFPLPRNENPVITFDRETALVHEDVEFVTLDHPMLTGALDLFLSSERGTCAFVTWSNPKNSKPLLELLYVLECIAPSRLNASRFLPPVPVRIVVDAEGKEVAAHFPVEKLNGHCTDSSPSRFKEQAAFMVPLLEKMMEAGESSAEACKGRLVDKTLTAMHQAHHEEAMRLRMLQQRGCSESGLEMSECMQEEQELEKHIRDSRLRLDSMRIVWPHPGAAAQIPGSKNDWNRAWVSEFDDEEEEE